MHRWGKTGCWGEMEAEGGGVGNGSMEVEEGKVTSGATFVVGRKGWGDGKVTRGGGGEREGV